MSLVFKQWKGEWAYVAPFGFYRSRQVLFETDDGLQEWAIFVPRVVFYPEGASILKEVEQLVESASPTLTANPAGAINDSIRGHKFSVQGHLAYAYLLPQHDLFPPSGYLHTEKEKA